MELRQKNPMKQLAMNLAHQMDRERDLRANYNRSPWEREGILADGKELRDEIWKKGYDITTILHYAEEYKTLSWARWTDWQYE